MKFLQTSLLVTSIALLASCGKDGGSNGKSYKAEDLNDLSKKASYALGYDMARTMKVQAASIAQQAKLDTAIIMSAIFDVFNSKSLAIDTAQVQQIMMDYQAELQKNAQAEVPANEEAGKKYIQEQMAANPNLKQTASGLVYEVLQEGTGKKPSATSSVEAKYKGSLINGEVFDQQLEQPITFPLSNVIKGWQEGLPLMSEGSKYRFIIPASLGYGEQGNPKIPGGSTLIFEVELVSVK